MSPDVRIFVDVIVGLSCGFVAGRFQRKRMWLALAAAGILGAWLAMDLTMTLRRM